MNYLELCRRVSKRAGIAGAGAGKPESVVGEKSHRLGLVIDYVAEAVRQIESEYSDWSFMRPDIDFFVDGGDEALDPSGTQPDVTRLNEQSVFARDQQGNRIRLRPVPWAAYREWAALAYATTDGIPDRFAADPSGAVYFLPPSSIPFVLRAECVLKPATLAANADVPHIPEEYHDAIIWKALALYHENDEAFDLMQTAERHYAEWLSRMEGACLPGREYRRVGSLEAPMVIRPV